MPSAVLCPPPLPVSPKLGREIPSPSSLRCALQMGTQGPLSLENVLSCIPYPQVHMGSKRCPVPSVGLV